MNFNMSPNPRTGLILVVLLVCLAGLIPGCSPSDRTESNNQSGQDIDASHRKLNQVVDNLTESLKKIQKQYPGTVLDGEVINDTRYKQVTSSARDAQETWSEGQETLTEHLPADQYDRTNEMMTELITQIESKGDTVAQQKLGMELLDTMAKLRTKALPDYRRGTVRSIRLADRHILAESTVDDYRIGVALQEARTIYRDTEPVSSAEGSSHQLRVLLREKRNKRFLPGADVEVRFQKSNGDRIESIDLLETWGPYHFYGQNVNVPSDAQQLSVHVDPPQVGRHADRKDLYIKPADVQFPLDTRADTVRVRGADPEPVPEEITLGSGIEMALEESLATKNRTPYHVGFIAEHAEPFWVFDTYRTDDETTSFNVRLADIPQSANHHLEVVLFDEETYRNIPHANITLRVKSRTKNTETRTHLPYLLSAFYHYGNSIYLPTDNYSVQATIWEPKIHTLTRDPFPERQTATFSWNPDGGKTQNHGADH